jgi:hypothetical protein
MADNSCPTENAISVPPKRRGRPATGHDPSIKVRVPVDLIAAIERWASKFHGLDRSAAIRALLSLGLEAGRKRNEVIDPKRYRQHARKAPLVKRRRRPPAASAPLLRLVKES